MSVAPSPIVIRALADTYTEAQLRADLELALAALTAEKDNVVLTSLQFVDGGGQGQYVEGNPERVVTLLQLALDYQANGDTAAPLSSSFNFGTRRTTT